MKYLRIMAWLAFAVVFSTPSLAQEPQFNALIEKAMKHYRARQYAEAITDFEAAYRINPQPELIYNVARAYEKSLKRDEAIAAYERFLKLEGTTADLRAKALNAQTALRKEKAAMQASRDVQDSVQAPTVGGTAATPKEGGVTVKQEVVTKPVSRTLEWVLIGGGGAAVAVGAIFGVLALQANADFDDRKAAGADVPELQDKKKRADNNALAADVLIGAGAVSVVVGAIIYFTRDSEEPDVAVAPVFGADYAAMAVSGRF